MAAVLVVAVLVTGPLVAGCGSPDDETVRPPTPQASISPSVPDDLPGLPVGKGDVAPGDEVHGDGTFLVVRGKRIPVAPLQAGQVAVVAGGVFFLNGTELWFTDLTRAQPTGFEDVSSLVGSLDGRRIGFLDLAHGPKDASGVRLALAMAYDAVTGKPLVASYQGMGDLATDDLGELYADEPPAVLGFTRTAIRVHGADGHDYSIPLDGGAPVRLD